MSKKRAFLALVFFPVILLPVHAYSGDRTSPGAPSEIFRISLSSDHETATLLSRGARLSDLLADFSERTGIMIVFDPDADAPVTVDVEAVPLRAALRHLLRGVSYAEVWRDAEGGAGNDTPSAVYVFPRSKASPGRDAVVFGKAPRAPHHSPPAAAGYPKTASAKRPGYAPFMPSRPRGEYGYAEKARVTAYLEKKKKAKSELQARESGSDSRAGKARALAAYLEKNARRDSGKSASGGKAGP